MAALPKYFAVLCSGLCIVVLACSRHTAPSRTAVRPTSAPAASSSEVRADAGVGQTDAAQRADPRFEFLVRAWVDTLHQRKFKAHRSLFGASFRCTHEGRAMKAVQCMKRKRSQFGPHTTVELIKRDVIDFGKRGRRSNTPFEVRHVSDATVLSFSIDKTDRRFQKLVSCELRLVREKGRLLIGHEVMELIDKEAFDSPPLRSNCKPPKRDYKHCLLLETPSRDPLRVKALVARLKREGYSAGMEYGEVSVDVTAREAKRLFNARFVYRWVARSARTGQICNAYIEGVRIPRRFKTEIRSVWVGHQICE